MGLLAPAELVGSCSEERCCPVRIVEPEISPVKEEAKQLDCSATMDVVIGWRSER